MKKLTKIDTNGAEATILQRLDTKQKRISETKRLLTLVLGLFCMICTSFGSYTFNLVSDQFQTRYNLSQRDMTAITTCGSVVGNVVLPYSFVYDFFGPLPIAILCIIVFPLGALLIAFCFEEDHHWRCRQVVCILFLHEPRDHFF
ncbi:hypothetical protein ADEAN_000795100 [Angomonas deanei]|uniref:Nodulin-like n=1 Tax=Angomonas deanei TaxID=59799 RepID=A0A7G2CLX4_9TRYP|nr:hypothetical protein ADEAN_000795100 [Angomonas deanei]